MSRVRKYLKGDKLAIMDAVDAILCGEYVFHWDKPVHPCWIGSWSLHLLNQTCRAGAIFRAIKNPEYIDKESAE